MTALRLAAISLALALPLTAAAPRVARLAQLRQGLAGDDARHQQARQGPERGVAAYVPPGARAQGEDGVFDAVALLAIPLVRTPAFPSDAPSAFFSTHALSDRQFLPRLRRFLNEGRRALVTSRLAARLGVLPVRYADRLYVVSTAGGPASLLQMRQTSVDSARNFILYPLGLRIHAPPRVALAVFGHQALIVENFNDYAAGIKMTFRKPVWPDVAGIETGDGEAEIRVDYNLAQVQVAPRTARLLRVVPR
jgi:hypothetical protein